MYKNGAVSLNEFSEAKNILVFACTVKRQIANVLLGAKRKKLPSEELEQMKAVSNVIKQCGVVTENYHERCFTQCCKDNMVKPLLKTSDCYLIINLSAPIRPIRHFEFTSIKREGR